jgi:hypothetical protein
MDGRRHRLLRAVVVRESGARSVHQGGRLRGLDQKCGVSKIVGRSRQGGGGGVTMTHVSLAAYDLPSGRLFPKYRLGFMALYIYFWLCWTYSLRYLLCGSARNEDSIVRYISFLLPHVKIISDYVLSLKIYSSTIYCLELSLISTE